MDDFDIEALIEAPFRNKKSSWVDNKENDLAKREKDIRRKDNYSRSRSPKHSRHYSSRSRSPPRHRSRRSPSPSKRREEESKIRSYEQTGGGRGGGVSLTDAQRDRRTVFCRQLAQRLDSRQLKEFCEQAGKVRDARIVYDKISRRSKGVAYVEFCGEESVPLAVALTGQKLLGIPIIIELTETEKNRIAEEAAAALRLEKLNSLTSNLKKDEKRQDTEGGGVEGVESKNSNGIDAEDASFDLEDDGEKFTETLLKVSREISALKSMASSSKPSPCLLLQHMYNPAQETDPNWHLEIVEEVKEECIKYGRIEHVNVPKTVDGDVFIRFGSTDSAQAAASSLNGRWFGGQQILATFLPLKPYLERFPSK